MEISYKRTHKESYMIISTEEYVSDYEAKKIFMPSIGYVRHVS